VLNTHKSGEIRQLHGALMDVVGTINRPQPDLALIKEAGISLDRALFPLLVIVERRGPIGVVDLADSVGRDHSTVSRQIAKMEGLGLVVRHPGKTDRRVREALVTKKGKAMTDAIDAARERLAATLLRDWSVQDLQTLARLMRRFADDLSKRPARFVKG
jgi:DNA-binding MarR family transcriptional regulator